MRRISFLTAILIFYSIGYIKAQGCNYTRLSYTYNYIVKIVYRKETYNNIKYDAQEGILIQIINKIDNKIIQTIKVETTSIGFDSFKYCEYVKSYITHINENRDLFYDFVLHHEYCSGGYIGDFIVADFNFDGLEDFAVVVGGGGCCTYYKFFSQNENHEFIEDKFFDSLGFPNIEKNKKRISYGPIWWSRDTSLNRVYTYDKNFHKWNEKDSFIITHHKEISPNLKDNLCEGQWFSNKKDLIDGFAVEGNLEVDRNRALFLVLGNQLNLAFNIRTKGDTVLMFYNAANSDWGSMFGRNTIGVYSPKPFKDKSLFAKCVVVNAGTEKQLKIFYLYKSFTNDINHQMMNKYWQGAAPFPNTFYFKGQIKHTINFEY